MIPKLGPVRDIDLFFGSYLIVAFFAGLLLDRLALAASADRVRFLVLSSMVGSAAGSAIFLMGYGLVEP